MAYKAAIIGCHGVGKTTLVRQLADKFKVFSELSINSFMGYDSFLSEIKIITDNILLNKKIGETAADSISDRFAFLDALIYSEAFYTMGWINDEQLRTIYSVVNNSKHCWTYPEKILVMNDSKDIIMRNILKRGRDPKLNETDKKFLEVTLQYFNDFFTGHLELKMLKQEIRDKLMSIPRFEIRCGEPINNVLNILNN